jgi:hypothetical protein
MQQQEVFDIVVKHLFTQRRQSMTNSYPQAYCAYRGVEGTKCAVGILIPDDVYTEDMEEKCVDELRHQHGDVLPQFIMDYHSLLQSLQNVHDHYMVTLDEAEVFSPHRLWKQLVHVAAANELDIDLLVTYKPEGM